MFVLSKFKAFADDISNVTKMVKFVCDRVENIVGQGETASYLQTTSMSNTCIAKMMKSHLIQ